MRARRSLEIAWTVGCLGALAIGSWLASCGPSSEAPATPAPKAGAAQAANQLAPKDPPKVEPRGPAGWYATYAASGAPDSEWVKTSSAHAAFALAEGQTIHPALAPAG